MQMVLVLPSIRLCAALTFLASLAPCQSPTASAPGSAATSDRALLERIAILGASVSAGYGLAAELEADADLGTVLECALRADPGSVVVAAEQALFMNPHQSGRRLLDRVLSADPTLVIALDFLFWFPFGPEPDERARIEELETGLAMLGEVKCPLVVGDFPDVSEALHGEGPFGFPLVSPDLLASPETRAALNARLREWAAARGDVVVVPMADFLDRMRRGEPVSVRDNRWSQGALRAILQRDLLHPTVDGVIALALLALDVLDSGVEGVPADRIEWDVAGVREELMRRTESERERRREAERERAERRRKAREGEESGDGGDPKKERKTA